MTGRTKKEAEMKTKMKMKMSEQSAQPSIGYVLSNISKKVRSVFWIVGFTSRRKYSNRLA